MIKLIALDMDGTLLDSNKKVPDGLTEWVINHPEIQVVIASGRQYYALEAQFKDIKDKLVFLAENGAVIVRNDEVLYKAPMIDEAVNRTLQLCKDNNYKSTIVCGLKAAYMSSEDVILNQEATKYYARRENVKTVFDPVGTDDIFKIAIYFHDNSAETYYNIFPEVPEGLTAVLSGDSWIDVSNTGVDKGSAIVVLQKLLGITADECMVFGDYLNDLTMFEACTHSFAMANAHPELKKAARYITEYTNDQNGVLRQLKTTLDS